MAYDRRIDELQERFKSIAAANPDDPTVPRIYDCLKNYGDCRRSLFHDLFDLINNADVSASDLQDHWQSRVQHAQEELDGIFHDPVSDAYQVFWTNMIQAEKDFFDALAAVKSPQYMEDFLRNQGVLAQLIDKLQGDWSDLLFNDKDLENAQLNTVKQIDELMQALMKEVEEKNQALIAETAVQLRNKMKEKADQVKTGLEKRIGPRGAAAATAAFKIAIEVAKQLLGIPSIPDEVKEPFEAQKEKLKIYVEMLAAFSQAYRDQVAQYRNLMSTEKGGVLTMFKATRDQVTEYQKNNNLVTSQIIRDEAKRFLSEWADHAIEAQRDDAAEFNLKIFDVIDKNWKVTEEMAKHFEEKFSGVFYAPLTSDTMETLTESYLFRQAIDSINGRNVAAKLEESQKLLSGSIEETANQAVQPLSEMSTDWSSDMKEIARLSQEDFRNYVRDTLKSQIDLALNSLGELRFLIDPPKVVADFTREELDAMLRG